MSTQELKTSIRALVENCEDKNLLDGIYKILNSTQKPEEKDWWDELSDEDRLRLEESILQYGKGDYEKHETIMQKAKKWLNK